MLIIVIYQLCEIGYENMLYESLITEGLMEYMSYLYWSWSLCMCECNMTCELLVLNLQLDKLCCVSNINPAPCLGAPKLVKLCGLPNGFVSNLPLLSNKYHRLWEVFVSS